MMLTGGKWDGRGNEVLRRLCLPFDAIIWLSLRIRGSGSALTGGHWRIWHQEYTYMGQNKGKRKWRKLLQLLDHAVPWPLQEERWSWPTLTRGSQYSNFQKRGEGKEGTRRFIASFLVSYLREICGEKWRFINLICRIGFHTHNHNRRTITVA